MAVKREKIHFASVEELLGAPVDKEGTVEIRIDQIFPFENHPFKVLDDEKMDELVESIKANGVLSPVLVRPDDEGSYEMISGHRRMHAAKLAGLTLIPAIIKEMTDDEATICMVDANVQREEILPSERAFSFKMKMDAMNRQGKRLDLTETSGTEFHKLDVDDRKTRNAYQIRQSFKPGEITAEEANQIGYETAMRFTKGEHAFLVCTHTDKEHIHNHVIFNSVNLACDRKFRDSWFCGIGLRRLSDMICLEHGLSVIKPYEKRGKKPKYEKSYRDEIREEIDKVLATKPQDFNRFLQLLREDEYEIKKGKYLAIKQKERKNFVRFKSLGEEYSEEKIRAVIAGEDVAERPTAKRKFDLLIDIQEKLRQGKGRGYELWGKRFNNKAITNTLLYLSEKGIRGYDDLKEKADVSVARFHELTNTIKASEQRMAEISELKKHIFNYSKTRDVYVAYQKSGYSKKFFEAHREELTLHKAAKDAFKKIDGKLPTVKELNAEYAEAYVVKKKAYSEYKLSKQEMKELQDAKRNIELFLELDAAAGREKKEKDRSTTAR